MQGYTAQMTHGENAEALAKIIREHIEGLEGKAPAFHAVPPVPGYYMCYGVYADGTTWISHGKFDGLIPNATAYYGPLPEKP